MRYLLLATVLALTLQGTLAQDGAAPAAYSATVHDVLDPAQFKAQLTSAPGTLVDVRTPDECAEGIIADATKPVYLYCAAGGRSYKAAQYLLKNGYTYVVELNGGMQAWLEAGQTVVPPGKASNR
jgi:rhodanese-related sulfurtransferase